MNHCVPDFQMDDDYSGLNRLRKSPRAEDEIMELLWQNGQLVMHSQNQRSFKKSPPSKQQDGDQSATKEIRPSHHQHQQQQQQQQSVTDHLFMQEDEMASWLHFPLNDTTFDSYFCADILYPSAPCVTSIATTTTSPPARPIEPPAEPRHPPVPASASAVASSSKPPIPPVRGTELDSSRIQNFAHFSRHKARVEQSGPSNSKSVVRELTVVDSCETPAVVPESRGFQGMPSISNTEGTSGGNNNNACGTIVIGGAAAVAASTHSAGVSIGAGASSREDLATCELTVTSSPGCSSASAEPAAPKVAAEDRKRKGREAAGDAECRSEDAEFESPNTKKQARGSTSTKRSRAAEVHNLSERRRRDRINEKMRALQELIPRCNKSDKASMLDEAIEYLKSLQLQIQMMSMGCGMVPMMFPGFQQLMPPMGMGMGMGMGVEMGMSRPMMPFPNVLAGPSLPTAAAAAHLGARFPMPAFHMLPPVPDPSRIQPNNQSDTMLSSLGLQTPNQPWIPSFADPYQQYLGLHQMQLPLPQNQATGQPSSNKPGTSKDTENLESHPPGT